MAPSIPRLLRLFFAVCLAVTGRADEPFLRPHDVVAFVGGEDMVALSEYGYLELLLVRALPDHQLRFRNLAWEGDTVFEQRRDLNFPTWEEQLDKVGATVVIAQFGQMESLAGKEKLPEFIAAYEKLIERMSGGRKRRVVVVQPTSPEYSNGEGRKADRKTAGLADAQWKAFPAYWKAITDLGTKIGPPFGEYSLSIGGEMTRDHIHVSDTGASFMADETVDRFLTGDKRFDIHRPLQVDDEKEFLDLIRAKNRLWFDYWRPQNWAFLAGDRTNQPSSRDHLDPSKRWFPPEREAFLPLIEAKEKEIDVLAQKLAKP
ncbi:MAG: hypothetical protein WCF18_23225 [Chthoniobacteraceae bacterium]